MKKGCDSEDVSEMYKVRNGMRKELLVTFLDTVMRTIFGFGLKVFVKAKLQMRIRKEDVVISRKNMLCHIQCQLHLITDL